jgi:HK97 family phage portal protein
MLPAVKWPWTKTGLPVTNSVPVSVREWGFAAMFAPGGVADYSGAKIDQDQAMGLSAVFRAVSLVAGTLGSLPLETLRRLDNGTDERVTSIFDDPDGPDGQTQFEWTETFFAHLMIHGKAGALKIRNAAGGLVRLPLVHPGLFTVEAHDESKHGERPPVGGYWFRVQIGDGKYVKLDGESFWWVPAMSLDGRTGLGLLQVARGSLATTQAGDRRSHSIMANGAQMSGIASPEDDLEEGESLDEVRRELNAATAGVDNAGKIALVTRRLNFTPWAMTAVDAQLLGSRQFQIEEVARWSGVPPHLLMQTEKQTSWGTGVEEQNRALGRTVLNPWSNRLEGRGSRLLANPRRLQIDFSGLERPSPDKEIELLLKQTGGKPILTQNEARKRLGLPPVAGGNVLNAPAPAQVPAGGDPDPEGDPDADA